MQWLLDLIAKHTKDGVLDTEALTKEISTEFPKHAVPKTEFNTLNDTKKDLEQQIKDRDKQLKDLQEKAKGNEDLEKSIKDLQEANKTAKETYEAKLKDLTINAAIQGKLTDTKYPDLLLTKFDKTKLVVEEDGKVSGIDDQLKAIKEQYKDLFTPTVKGKESENKGSSSKGITKEQFKNMGYKERVELFNTDKELYDSLSE